VVFKTFADFFRAYFLQIVKFAIKLIKIHPPAKNNLLTESRANNVAPFVIGQGEHFDQIREIYHICRAE
jgi:hypothetical protein